MFLYIFRISLVDYEGGSAQFYSPVFFENSICFLFHLWFPKIVLLRSVDLLIKYRSIMILQKK